MWNPFLKIGHGKKIWNILFGPEDILSDVNLQIFGSVHCIRSLWLNCQVAVVNSNIRTQIMFSMLVATIHWGTLSVRHFDHIIMKLMWLRWEWKNGLISCGSQNLPLIVANLTKLVIAFQRWFSVLKLYWNFLEIDLTGKKWLYIDHLSGQALKDQYNQICLNLCPPYSSCSWEPLSALGDKVCIIHYPPDTGSFPPNSLSPLHLHIIYIHVSYFTSSLHIFTMEVTIMLNLEYCYEYLLSIYNLRTGSQLTNMKLPGEK